MGLAFRRSFASSKSNQLCDLIIEGIYVTSNKRQSLYQVFDPREVSSSSGTSVWVLMKHSFLSWPLGVINFTLNLVSPIKRDLMYFDTMV